MLPVCGDATLPLLILSVMEAVTVFEPETANDADVEYDDVKLAEVI